MSRRIDENELRALFEEIEAPDSLDRWRDRIADVHAEELDDEPPKTNGASVITLPTDRELRPHRPRKRSVAVAAAAAVVVGLGGVVVTSQLLNDAPPADPTMIIDGPDHNTATSPPPPTSGSQSNTGSADVPPPESGPDHPGSGGVTTDTEQPGGINDPQDVDVPGGGDEPSWPAMVGYPSAANTGVPLGASLGDHHGDLRITTAGQVVADLRVTGTIIIDAPNVTLRRVVVVASYGAPAVRQNASGLTVENSELNGGSSLVQSASGLVVRRSRLESGMTIISGAQVYDSFLDTANVLIPSGSNTVLLRHNVMGLVTMSDIDAPIRGVTIESGVLNRVDAPTDPGSASIHVLGNRFRDRAPSTGWNSSATDYRWADNTFADTGAPAEP